MQPKSKGELLEHYAAKPVAYFAQFDGFANIPPSDPVMASDPEGDALCATHTAELRSTDAAVRIHIAQGVKQADAVRLLDKLREWIASPGMAGYAEPPFLDPQRAQEVDGDTPF